MNDLPFPLPTTTTSYYLRSSVLGGRTVTEYDAAGARHISYTYAGGGVLTETTKTYNDAPWQQWRHTNPVTGDAVNTDTQGKQTGLTRLDPAGTNVGESDPFIDTGGGGGGGAESPVEADRVGLVPIEAGWGGGGGSSGMRCNLDGVEIGCGWVSQLMGIGAAAQCPNNDCGPRSVTYQGQQTWAFFNAYGDGYQGYVPSTARYTGNGNISPVNGLPPVLGGRGFSATDTNLGRLNGARSNEEVLGRSSDVMFLNANFGRQPPKTSPDQFTAKQFEQFKSCLSRMFQVEYKGHKFARGGESYFDGYTNRGAHWYSIKAIGDFTVRTDQQSYSSRDLTRKYTGIFGDTGGKLLVGYTDPGSPYVNAIANDAGMLIKGSQFLATWVHELGNSLSSITRISPNVASDAADRYDGDTDAGTAFEDCVFGGRVKSDGSVSPPR